MHREGEREEGRRKSQSEVRTTPDPVPEELHARAQNTQEIGISPRTQDKRLHSTPGRAEFQPGTIALALR